MPALIAAQAEKEATKKAKDAAKKTEAKKEEPKKKARKCVVRCSVVRRWLIMILFRRSPRRPRRMPKTT
jgi:hypothetical protein